MVNLAPSRPISRLATLSLAILIFTKTCPAAEDIAASNALRSNSVMTSGVVKVDARLLAALLTPVSHLITSSYDNLAAVENPLGVQRKLLLKTEPSVDEETLSISSAIHNRSYAPYKTYKSFHLNDLTMTSPKEDVPSSVQPSIDVRALASMYR